MSMQDYEEAVKLINANPEGADFFPVNQPDRIIALAEQKLALKFPPTYRKFLQQFGAGAFDAEEIYGIINEDFENSGLPDAIWFNLDEREKYNFPSSFFIFYSDGFEWLYALDTSQKNENEEYPVIAVPVGYYDLPKYEIIYEDFGAFFYDTIKMILEIIAEEETES